MGRAMGKVRFLKDNMMAWFIYNGTADFAYPRLFSDYKDFHETAWVDGDGYNYYEDNNIPHNCLCNEDEEVEIYESYGGGMLWTGRACRQCMVLTKGLSSEEYTDTLGDEELNNWILNGAFPEWCVKNFKLGF